MWLVHLLTITPCTSCSAIPNQLLDVTSISLLEAIAIMIDIRNDIREKLNLQAYISQVGENWASLYSSM